MTPLATLIAEHRARVRTEILAAHPRAPVAPSAEGPTLVAWAAVAGVTVSVLCQHRRGDPTLAALPTQGTRLSNSARATRARALRDGAPKRRAGRKSKAGE